MYYAPGPPPPQEEPKKDRGCLAAWYVPMLIFSSPYACTILTNFAAVWPHCAVVGCAARHANVVLIALIAAVKARSAVANRRLHTTRTLI